jgi:hypothetical protein
MDLETLVNGPDGRPVSGIALNGVPVWIGDYKYIAVYADSGDVINNQDTGGKGF